MVTSDGKKPDFTQEEIENRRDSALARLLNTPHTPTKEFKRPRRKPQSK